MKGYIPEPTIIMLGCRPWPPSPDPDTPALCPVCRHGIMDKDVNVHCGWCSSSSWARDSQLLAAKIGIAGRLAKDPAEQAANAAMKADLRRKKVLTEVERRRIWNGYRGGVLGEARELTNLSKTGREFLKAIGQEPDFSIRLDRWGNPIRAQRQEMVAG